MRTRPTPDNTLSSPPRRFDDLREKSIQETYFDHFCLLYQPQHDMVTGRIIGTESLARWHHPREGLIPPSRFIKKIQETRELSYKFDMWVLKKSCGDCAKLLKKYSSNIPVSVNICARTLCNPSFSDDVIRIIQKTGIPPNALDLEITESSALTFSQPLFNQLAKLKDYGIRISIDDFGEGYSSFSYIRKLNADTLKLDRSFTQAITHKRSERIIVQSVLSLCKKLGIRVIVEGIETQEQADILLLLDCHFSQGFLYNRPYNLADFFSAVSAQEKVKPRSAAQQLRIQRGTANVADINSVVFSPERKNIYISYNNSQKIDIETIRECSLQEYHSLLNSINICRD